MKVSLMTTLLLVFLLTSFFSKLSNPFALWYSAVGRMGNLRTFCFWGEVLLCCLLDARDFSRGLFWCLRYFLSTLVNSLRTLTSLYRWVTSSLKRCKGLLT